MKSVSGFITYLPFSLENLNAVRCHARITLQQHWPNLVLKIAQERLFPQPQGLGIVAADILNPFDN